MRKALKENLIRFSALFILAVLCFAIYFGGLIPPVAYADNAAYTGVLEDLCKDENFTTTLYPTKSNDYSLQVIQIAESTGKELFVYVYQPSGQAKNLCASSINISLKPQPTNCSATKFCNLFDLSCSPLVVRLEFSVVGISTLLYP